MVSLAFGQGRKDHLALMMALLTLVSVRAANQDPTPDIDAGPGGKYVTLKYILNHNIPFALNSLRF